MSNLLLVLSYGAAVFVGMTVGVVGMAALAIAGQADDRAARAFREYEERHEVTSGFAGRLHDIEPQVLQSFPESGAHDVSCPCASCYGLDSA